MQDALTPSRTSMKKTSTEKIEELEQKIEALIKMLSDVERVMLQHEQALTAFKADIEHLKKRHRNTYQVM